MDKVKTVYSARSVGQMTEVKVQLKKRIAGFFWVTFDAEETYINNDELYRVADIMGELKDRLDKKNGLITTGA